MRFARLPAEEFHGEWRRTVKTPYFILKIKKNKRTGDGNRVGVVAGVAVHKKAAKRNFWKRQTRAALAASVTGQGHDFLVMLSPAINTLKRKKFRELLAGALAQSQK